MRQLSRIGNQAQGLGTGSHVTVEMATSQPSESETLGLEYFPTPIKKSRLNPELVSLPEELVNDPTEAHGSTTSTNCFFFAEKAVLDLFVAARSKMRPCSTPDCEGILVPSLVERVGLGGGVKVTYSCNGCQDKNLHFNSSTYVLESRRSVVSLSVAVAFVLSGNTHAGYHKALARGLGIPVLSRRSYYEAIKTLYKPIKDILDDICAKSKQEMQKIPDHLIGSWNHAVTTADGCWTF
jgi:hypothetical protein